MHRLDYIYRAGNCDPPAPSIPLRFVGTTAARAAFPRRGAAASELSVQRAAAACGVRARALAATVLKQSFLERFPSRLPFIQTRGWSLHLRCGRSSNELPVSRTRGLSVDGGM